MLKTVLFAVPVFGWMLKSAWYGDRPREAVLSRQYPRRLGVRNLFIGYAALIVPLLLLAGLYLVGMVILTAGDLIP